MSLKSVKEKAQEKCKKLIARGEMTEGWAAYYVLQAIGAEMDTYTQVDLKELQRRGLKLKEKVDSGELAFKNILWCQGVKQYKPYHHWG